MKNTEAPTHFTDDAADEYETKKGEEINRRGREFSHSMGDTCEQKTGVFEWDINNDKSRFSLGVCNMIGVEQSHTVRGLFSIFQYVPAEEWQKVQDAFTQTVQSKSPLDIKFRGIRSDGNRILVHMKGKLTCDDAGTPYYLEGTIEDITEQQG